MQEKDVAETERLPNGCRVIQLSPFEVHFSQTRIRAEFQDGHTVEETTGQIEAVPCPARPGAGAASGVAEEEDPEKRRLLLRFPFPRIEVTKWQCKLREPNGTPKLDPATGLELYSQEETWFTFDNRRLCCLQRAAAELWPREVRCEVVEIPQTLARMRELRKFDTTTYGRSVQVGRRDDPNPETWSWRSKVGLPEESQPEGVARQKTVRWRGPRSSSGSRGPGPVSGESSPGSHQQAASPNSELVRSALLFLLVYLILRITVSMFRHHRYSVGQPLDPVPVPAPPPLGVGGVGTLISPSG